MSVEFETYSLPPIQEAVLDIFVTVPGEMELETLSAFGKTVSQRFPNRSPRYQFATNIRVDFEDSSKSAAVGASTQIGWIYRTPGKERATQARLDGFAFNRLPVYEGWSKFRDEAFELWQSYKLVAAPQFVTSIGLRYINRLLLPLPFQDFREYCVLFPEFPKGLPHLLNDFVMRFSGPSLSVPDITSTITLTFEPPPRNKAVLPLILDVHVAQSFPAAPASDDKKIWDAFESLRVEKNIVFESCITEASRKLFRK